MPRALHQLNLRHQTAITMRLAGSSPAAIAEHLMVKRRTIYLWFSDPLIKGELARRVEQINDSVDDRLATVALLAIDRLGELVDSALAEPTITIDQKLDAIREILDRCICTTRLLPGTPNPIWTQHHEAAM
jgi:hypothetical protein